MSDLTPEQLATVRRMWVVRQRAYNALRLFGSACLLLVSRRIDPLKHSNAEQHGLTCADTPIDHSCGDTEMDQGVTWRQGADIDSAKLQRIAELHKQSTGEHGVTSGYCVECERAWPCPTYHVAAGWGLDEFYECEDTNWCKHAGVPM